MKLTEAAAIAREAIEHVDDCGYLRLDRSDVEQSAIATDCAERLREAVHTLDMFAAAIGDMSPNIVAMMLDSASKGAALFCWCVEHLEKFPPIEGDWRDDLKRRFMETASENNP
jgi:hypothetical protein